MINSIEEVRVEMKVIQEFISNMPENKKLNVITANFNGENNVLYHEKLDPENAILEIKKFNEELIKLEESIESCEPHEEHVSLLIIYNGDLILNINTEYLG